MDPQTVSFPQVRTAGAGGSGTRMRTLRIRTVEIRAVEIVAAEVPVPRASAPEVCTPEVLTFGAPAVFGAPAAFGAPAVFGGLGTVGEPERDDAPVAPGSPRRRGRIAAAVGVAAVGAAAMSTALFQTVVASSTSLPIHEPAPAAVPPAAGTVLAAPPAPSPAVYGDGAYADPWADPDETGR